MSDSNSSATPAKDTGYTPGDDFSTQWRNIFSILTGRMTPEGQEQFRLAKDIRNEAADCKRCEDQRDYLLQFSPTVKYLSDNIRQLGGDLGSHNIHCRRCTQRKAGGFDPEFGIQICANEMRDQGHLEDTMAHEMLALRSAQVPSAASVDGPENSFEEDNGNSRNSTRNVFEEEQYFPFAQDRSAKTKRRPKKS
ncbi:Ku70-binding protein [Talaromyces pinophilus]|uniref:Mitochondrial inner membrane protease ATP23 n=1 Tax=Talaromyces pinophilus TaxID=128442 RepID=A0A6V8H2K5_TALPI|nr:Ku70-binding protein [Talaromyces pinophilus]